MEWVNVLRIDGGSEQDAYRVPDEMNSEL